MNSVTTLRNKLAAPLENFVERINVFHILLLSILMAALSISHHRGGIMHPELEVRIPFYLADRPLLNKLYDSRVIEDNMFVARELSYVFDFLDDQFIALSVSLGYPHFISLSFYVFTILIGLVLWQFCVRELNLKHWIGLGMVLLFWTAPNAFLGGVYFRSAKSGLALCVVVVYYLVYHILHAERQNRKYRLSFGLGAACFGISWAATLFDREGVFMVGAVLVFLLLWASVFPTRNVLKLLGAFTACLALSFLYDYLIAPWLTFSLNHYWPDFSFQRIPWGAMLAPQILSLLLFWSASLYADTLRFLVGNIPQPAAYFLIITLIFMAFLVYLRARKIGEDTTTIATTTLGLIISDVVLMGAMIAIMVFKHSAVTWPDAERTYYFMPLSCTLCMSLALAISQFYVRRMLPAWLIFILLTAAIAGNVLAIPGHQAILIQGQLQPNYESAPRLLAALRNIKNSQYQVSVAIQQNPVYQLFRSRLGR